jgi:hypothetical protein
MREREYKKKAMVRLRVFAEKKKAEGCQQIRKSEKAVGRVAVKPCGSGSGGDTSSSSEVSRKTKRERNQRGEKRKTTV